MIAAIVAIPVRNEEERIVACLDAIARQTGIAIGSLAVVLLVNNTTDGTMAAIETARRRLSHALRVVVRDAAAANAGWARRGAMDCAATWFEQTGRSGAILTTDADSRVADDWVARTLAALAAGADAVAGRISLDPADAARLSPALQARGRLEATYHALLDEVAARVDPDPADPWPNHTIESGASLAVTLAAYRAVGGMPPIALGDDRAFMARLRDHGFRIRHDRSVRVVTSGRLAGRAAGGVADTMRARQDDPDCPCDARLERFDRALFRLRWRRRLRRLHAAGRLERTHAWKHLLSIGDDQALAGGPEMPTWARVQAIENRSPVLGQQSIRPSALLDEIETARDWLGRRPGQDLSAGQPSRRA